MNKRIVTTKHITHTMSEIIIKPVESKKDLKAFIRLNHRLYKGNPYAVPDFEMDMLDTFNPAKNAAYEFCEAQLFLAYKNGKVVGRVAAIINNKANATWNVKNVRFGWIDMEDDLAITKALLDTVEQWGKERGMNKLVGPLGFTDMDPEGMLTGGYDQLSTMSTIYNYPYYPQHMEQLGMGKEVDWVERKVTVPSPGHHAQDDKYFRVAKICEQRFGMRIRKFKNAKEIKKDNYIHKIFDIINKAYAPLFGYSEMNEKQIDMYANNYLPFLDLRLVTVVETAEGQPVAVGICMHSLSRALQKAGGRLWPFGWWHLAKALLFKPQNDYLDMLLVAVLPEYQNKGVNAMLFADLIPIGMEMKFKWAETHLQLEDNDKSQGQWAYLDCEVHKFRRCYQREIK